MSALDNYTPEQQPGGLERLLTDLGITAESWTTPDPEQDDEVRERWDDCA